MKAQLHTLTSNQEVEGSRLHPPHTITISEDLGRLLDSVPWNTQLVDPYVAAPRYINSDHWSSWYAGKLTIEPSIEPHIYNAMEAMDWKLSEAKEQYRRYELIIALNNMEPKEDWWSYWK